MDNLSTVDKLPGPNVSFIERFHCIVFVRIFLFFLSKHMYTDLRSWLYNTKTKSLNILSVSFHMIVKLQYIIVLYCRLVAIAPGIPRPPTGTDVLVLGDESGCSSIRL